MALPKQNLAAKYRAIAKFACGAGGLFLLACSFAFAQTVEIPQRAFANLYEIAQKMTENPASEYVKDNQPDFPYPSDIQKQWDDSIAAHGNDLTVEERKQLIPCAAKLNSAITSMEIGYRIEITQPGNDEAQASAQKRYASGRADFAECASAYETAKSGIPAPTANLPQQGGTDATVVDGTPEEAALPGSIDWTPALDPLFTYLSNEWQRVINDPKNRDWAPDDAGNSLTVRIQPNQPPEVVDKTGSRDSVFDNIMQSSKVPAPAFPAGSTLRSVLLTSKFFVKSSGKIRTRYKYYERDGQFKRYQPSN